MERHSLEQFTAALTTALSERWVLKLEVGSYM